MKTLSKTAQQKACDFIVAQARPLERALYQYEFEQRSQEAVLEELGTFVTLW